jgi:luciferase family oxidoreductase group 1
VERLVRGRAQRPAALEPAVSNLPAVPLSVLDLAPVGEGVTHGEALRQSIALAQAAEDLGYARFWLAEHHSMPGIASSATSLLIGQVAAATRAIRVGSGGVMLPNHPPLVVAEQFGTLTALFPGRVDLGIGRAPGTDQVTARALRRSVDALSAEDFPQQLGELLAFFKGTFPADHPYRAITAVPGLGDAPPLWLLGSSGYSAQVAGLLGLPFAFAHHFSGENTVPALELYRRSFQPSDVLDRPYAMVAVNVIAAEDDAQARRLALPGQLQFLRLRTGDPGKLPTPEEAEAYPWTPAERAFGEERMADQAVGGPETVRRKLAALLERTGADELMVTSMLHDPADRVRSLEITRALFPAELPAAYADAPLGEPAPVQDRTA